MAGTLRVKCTEAGQRPDTRSVETLVARDTEGRMTGRDGSHPGQDDGGNGGGRSGNGENTCIWSTCWRRGRFEFVTGCGWRLRGGEGMLKILT